MPVRPEEPPLDYGNLADLLTTLGSPVRLQLLKQLRFAHTLGEIKVQPHRASTEHRPDRVVARQTVREHLDRLIQKGLVHTSEVERDGRRVLAYSVNPTSLYALMEDLRSMSTLYAGRGLATDPTGTLRGDVEPEDVTGPHLVLAHGVYEGKPFPLDRSTQRDDGWTIGRRKGLPVSLDYDPYVSLENARVIKKRSRFLLQDLGSKNGTLVNWRLLEPKGVHELRPADIVGVGRSLLVFNPG